MTDPSPLETVRSVEALRAKVAAWRSEGQRIGFVPTMGALHEGHLSLVRLAAERADKVVASVFVNPTQFAPGEDFESYPRDEARDAGLLKQTGCDLLFAPERDEMYAPGFATTVTLSGPAEGLETDRRPHFFNGVATVVTKLLNQVRPDIAVFGEKDYQQLLVIRRLVVDLDLGVDIIGGATLREMDGLAMSSRNAYLDADQREIAGALNRILRAACEELRNGAEPARAELQAREALLRAGFDSVDYVAARDAGTLAEPEDAASPDTLRVLGAARIGGVRLIDNMAV